VPDKENARKWQVAFARQSQADFEAWQHLEAASDVAACEKLHMLQMACEKLTKAHLCSSGSDPDEIQSSHAYVAKNLPVIARHQFAIRTGKQPAKYDERLRNIKLLAQEIEYLHPNLNADGQRPDNCEYPWKDSAGVVHAPVDHTFAGLNLLQQPAGRTLLKVIEFAAERLIEDGTLTTD